MKWFLSLFFITSVALTQTLERPPQFVLISFDGSKSHNFWKETFLLADEADAQFSYFISGVYFLRKADRANYHPPRRKAGVSDIGFAEDDLNDIKKRTEFIWNGLTARSPAIEIGSHVNGHFDGTAWTPEEWTQEFTEFHKLVENVFNFYPALNTPFKKDWQVTVNDEVRGFRAPLLAGKVATTAEVLKNFGYAYDASQVLKYKWPYKHTPELWNMGLSRIALAGTNRETIAMDYNVLYGHCNGVFNPQNAGECKTLNDELLAHYEAQTYASYVQAFLKNYYGNRAPLSIGHHFSLWNKGIYWKALQRFVKDVCTQPEVHCVSHKTMVNWLNERNDRYGYSVFTKYNQGAFSKTDIPDGPKNTLNPNMPVTESIAKKKYMVPIISDAAEKVMLQGDLPHAHNESPNDIDLEPFRVR